MANRISLLVEKELSNFFDSQNFRVSEYMTQESGLKEIVIYDSSICKLKFYHSHRDGEVNCQVSRDTNALINQKECEWTYLYSIIFNQEKLSVEELLTNVPSEPTPAVKQIRKIAQNLIENFSIVITWAKQ